MRLKKALLIADLQNDFCPKGALGVRGGDRIVPVVNKYIKAFSKAKLPVFLTRDWHPKATKHFKGFGGPWPKHCVERTKGAEFHPKLKFPKETIILSKGMDPETADSYSAFQAVDANGASLFSLLKILGIDQLYIGGLATDYCVKYSITDAIKSGFKVKVLADAVKGVNLKPGDSKDALDEMVSRGAKLITFEKLKI